MTEPALRAGDADRDRVVASLRQHLVEGRLTIDEFVERAGLAHEAKTLGDLEELQRDLPAVREPAAAEVRAARAHEPPAGKAKWLIAVMSGIERKSRWRLTARTNVVAVMGGAHLDLRNAELESAESRITIVAVMGGTDVIVPEGIRVEVDGFAFMGGKTVRLSEAEPLPDAPFIRIRVVAVMGGVNVRSKGGARRGGLPSPPPLPR
jgi:hypothetical protein